MQRWLNFKIIGALIVVGGAGLWLSQNSHWIRIQTVVLELSAESKETLLFERIRKSLAPQYQKFIGEYYWQIPLAKVYEITTKDKRVRHVSVYREFPSRLRIEIEPYTPVFSYLSSDRRLYPVATDATLLPALPNGDAPDLPLLRGEELRDEQRLREVALELFDLIPVEGSLKKKNVSEILYSKKEGFKIFVSGSAVEVKMGEADFGPKISRVQKVLSYLESQNIKGRVIDARFSKKVVVRVRKSP